MNIDKLIKIIRSVNEETVIANNVGSGNIAGTPEAGDDPPVGIATCSGNKKKRNNPTIIGRGCFPGSRKRWSIKK